MYGFPGKLECLSKIVCLWLTIYKTLAYYEISPPHNTGLSYFIEQARRKNQTVYKVNDITAKFHQLCSVAISVSVVDVIDVIKSDIVIKWVALKRNDPERPEFRVPRPTIQNDSAIPLYADLKQNTRHIVLTNSPLSEWPIEPREGILVLIIISSDQVLFTPRQYFFFIITTFV